MTEFKVGDRVVCTKGHLDMGDPTGLHGVIRGHHPECTDYYAVEFKGWGHGHDASLELGNDGWYLEVRDLELATEATPTDNPIFHYRASQELDTEAWGKLVLAVHSLPKDWDHVNPMFHKWESEYKAETGLPIPGAWRSAKSVIKKAFSVNVNIVDPTTGEPLGKTFVENSIKSRTTVDDKDPGMVLVGMIETVIKYAEKHTLDWKAPFEYYINK